MLNVMRRKLKAIVEIWKAKDILKTIVISPETEARIRIENILRGYAQKPRSNVDIKAISDEILSEIRLPKIPPTEKSIEKLLDGALGQAYWQHSQLAGLTTIWEFRVRLLGNKLGVRPNVPIPEKKRKNRANKSVEHRLLSETIKEIEKKTGNRLNLKLLELSELRNSIVHCNPQGIKTYSIPLFGKNVLQPVRGNVVVLKMSSESVKNLSDIKDENDIEEQDVFGWFLEVFNSQLPEMAFRRFEDSVKSLDLLIGFSASSFDERKNICDDLFFNGKRPDDKAIALYQEYFSSPYSPENRDATQFFAELLKCFRNLNP